MWILIMVGTQHGISFTLTFVQQSKRSSLCLHARLNLWQQQRQQNKQYGFKSFLRDRG